MSATMVFPTASPIHGEAIAIELDRCRRVHDETSERLARFSAGILHEIGNPITAIAGLVDEMYTERGAGPRRDARLEAIVELLGRMEKTVRDVSCFTAPLSRQREPLNLNTLAEMTLRMLMLDPRWSRVDVSVDLDRDIPAVVGVASDLVQAISNLLANSMEAVEALDDRPARIVLATRREQDAVALCVVDNGRGMTEEVRSLATRPFFSTKPPGLGSGFGLTFCQEVVGAHGGSLEIESQPGRGTTVTVRLEGSGEA
jgi:signal transduction histidine kinase